MSESPHNSPANSRPQHSAGPDKDFLQKAAQLRESQLTALASLKRILENVKKDEKNNYK